MGEVKTPRWLELALEVCEGSRPDVNTLRAIPHRRGCTFWDLTADHAPVFVETLVTAWDLDVRAFFATLMRDKGSRLITWNARDTLDEAMRLAEHVEKVRESRRSTTTFYDGYPKADEESK